MAFNRDLFQTILQQGLESLSLKLSESEIQAMGQFAELILATNQTLNLTRITTPEEMAIKNFLDSLSLLCLAWPAELSCLDVGTGAGFPGVPLGICGPGWSIVLLDSLRKRLNFLEEAVLELGLKNLTTLHSRAEDGARDPEHRGRYDLVVSRAVANLPVLLELCTPFVKVGGHFVAYKSSEAKTELENSRKAMHELNMESEQVFSLKLPLDMGERNLIVLRKVAPTPRIYPRRAGLPNKQPLI